MVSGRVRGVVVLVGIPVLPCRRGSVGNAGVELAGAGSGESVA